MPEHPKSANEATIIRSALSRTPEWVRSDLAAKDPSTRIRAEETLAAMLEAVLGC